MQITEELFMGLPQELKECINILEELLEKREKGGNKFSDRMVYKNQLSIFLSDIKIAQLNGQISPPIFEELKRTYLSIM